jgi:hypothetical protein
MSLIDIGLQIELNGINKMKQLAVIVVILVFIVSCQPTKDINSKNILNSSVAIKVGKKALREKYGMRICRNNPYYAKLINDSTWYISGTPRKNRKGDKPVVVLKTNGKVIKAAILK